MEGPLDSTTIPRPPQSTDIGGEDFDPLGSHPLPPPPAFLDVTFSPDATKSSFVRTTHPGWDRDADGRLVRNDSVVSWLDPPTSMLSSDGTVITPQPSLSVIEEDPEEARRRRRAERAQTQAQRAALGRNQSDGDFHNGTRATLPP